SPGDERQNAWGARPGRDPTPQRVDHLPTLDIVDKVVHVDGALRAIWSDVRGKSWRPRDSLAKQQLMTAARNPPIGYTDRRQGDGGFRSIDRERTHHSEHT